MRYDAGVPTDEAIVLLGCVKNAWGKSCISYPMKGNKHTGCTDCQALTVCDLCCRVFRGWFHSSCATCTSWCAGCSNKQKQGAVLQLVMSIGLSVAYSMLRAMSSTGKRSEKLYGHDLMVNEALAAMRMLSVRVCAQQSFDELVPEYRADPYMTQEMTSQARSSLARARS